MIVFKFLQRGAKGPLTGFVWTPQVWVETSGPLAPCRNGAHLLRPHDLAHWMHEELWRAELDGEWIEGADCLIARRARVTERVEGWSGPDGEAFAQACHDRLVARLALATEPSVREHLTNYQWAVNWHIERRAIAMAGYVSALGLAQLAKDETTIDAYRRERAWQSEWLVRALRLL
jgi:hypothetical protein